MTEKPEFSRLFDTTRLPPEGKTETISASPQECAELAQRFGVEAVEAVTATIDVQPWRRGGFRGRGTASAKVVQQCVITLDSFEAEVNADLDRLYVSAPGKYSTNSSEVVVSLDDDDIGQVVDGDIELGELAVEELLLVLEPYPRKPGAVLEQSSSDLPLPGGQEGKINPFAVLKDLKLKKTD